MAERPLRWVMSSKHRVTVVSLGYRCDVAYQIRAHFGVEAAMPFDWLVTPLTSISLMLEEGFSHMADPEWLEPFETTRRGRPFVCMTNRRYQVLMSHEFPVGADQSLAPDWRRHVPEVAAKWAHLSDRWRRTIECDAPIAFVRRGGHLSLQHPMASSQEAGGENGSGIDPIVNDAVLETRRAEAALTLTPPDAYRDLLCALRRAAPTCQLLVIDPGCDLRDSDILTATVGLSGPADWPNSSDYWKGPPSAWRRALNLIGAS